MTRICLAIGAFLLTGFCLCTIWQQEKLPKEVQQAEETLNKWLKDLIGKSQEEIRKTLGKPTSETTWELDKKKLPRLDYKIGKHANIHLFFDDDGTVLTSSFSIARSFP